MRKLFWQGVFPCQMLALNQDLVLFRIFYLYLRRNAVCRQVNTEKSTKKRCDFEKTLGPKLTQAEGFVLGVGAKMFSIAGPVILYGTVASVIYGVIYWITTLF